MPEPATIRRVSNIDVPPPIGSLLWDRELQTKFGVTSEEARRLSDLARAEAIKAGKADDPHSMSFIDCSIGSRTELNDFVHFPDSEASRIALVAAAWVLIHQALPSYAAQMYLRMNAWHPARVFPDVRRWILRQLAAMILHGPEAVTESAWYAVDVDYFEDRDDSSTAFPALVRELGPGYMTELLAHSSYLAWPVKRDVYQRAASDTRLHNALAQALTASCDSAFLGSIELGSAREIARELHVSNETRNALEGALRAEFTARLIGVDTDLELRCTLVAFDCANVPSWFEGAAVYHSQKLVGCISTFRARFGPLDCALLREWRSARLGTTVFAKDFVNSSASFQWHRVDGDAERWLLAVGDVLVLRGR